MYDQKQPRRIYADMGAKGVPTNYALTWDGQVIDAPTMDTRPADKRLIQQNGCACWPADKIKAMANNNGLPTAVTLAERATGSVITTRKEGGWIDNQTQAFFFTVTNADAAAQNVLIGGGNGLLAAQLGLSAKDAQLTVTGTYSSTPDTMYTLLQTVPVSTPLDFHGLHIQSATTSGATDTTFFSLSQVSIVQGNPTGNNATQDRLNFKMLAGDQFNAFLREFPDFRFLLDGNSGIYIQSMPPGLAVTFTMQVSALGLVYNMVKA